MTGKIEDGTVGDIKNDFNIRVYSVADSVQKARHFFDWTYSRQIDQRMQTATIERMLDGAAPYNQSDLDAAGLGYITNKNFGESRFHVRSVEFTYWSLANEVKNLAKFIYDLPAIDENDNSKEAKTPPNYLIYEEMLGDVWTRSLKAWSHFRLRRALIGTYLARFGSALTIFDVKNSWYFKTVHPLNICLPVDATTVVNDWYFLGIITPYTAEELWELVKKPDVSKAAGWNIGVLKELLLHGSSYYSTKSGGATESNFSGLEALINNDPGSIQTQYTNDFKLVLFWYKTKEGKVGQGIFSKEYTTSDFLFKNENYADSFEEFCYLFTFHADVEFYQNATGVGHDIFELTDAITITDCRVLDQVHRASTLFMSSGNQVNTDSRGVDLTLGAVNDLGAGQLQQSNIFNAIAPTISGAQYFRQNLANSGVLGGFNASAPDSVKRSREELARSSTKEYKVYKNYTAHHYEQLDDFLKVLFKRFIKTPFAAMGGEERKYFEQRLKRQMFPLETLEGETNIFGLPVAWDVEASRILGSGSNTADQMLAQDLIGSASLLGPKGRKNLTRYWFALKTGYEHEQVFFPKEDDIQKPNNEDAIVALENNFIRMGLPVQFGENQDHFRHASAHAQVAIDLQNEVDSGQLDPAKYKAEPDEEPVIIANQVLQQLVPHWVQHMVAMDQDPLMKGEVQQLKVIYGSMVNFSRKIQAAAQSALEAKQNRAQKMSEQEMDLARQQNIDTQEIQGKYQKMIAELQIQQQKVARQVDAETLLGMERIRQKGDVDKFKAMMDSRQKAITNEFNRGESEQ